jgi:hypothetical protein
VPRDVADAIDIGDRSAAEFHYQTGHDKGLCFHRHERRHKRRSA